MVFIEERHDYLSSLADRPKLLALFALLSDQSFQSPPGDISETDTIYFASVQAIKQDSKNSFLNQYAKISMRKVSENTAAPFVHDDFLVFTLIIGVSKFECDKEWLSGVIHNRAKSPTTTTFENLLTCNYQSKANTQSLVLVFLFLLDKSKITNEQLIEAYEAISNLQQPYNNDFIRIIHYRAFDLIIQFKLPRDKDEVACLLEFETRFKKRINVFSYLAYNTLLLLVLVGAYRVLHALPDDQKQIVNDLNLVIGLGAVIGLSGNFIPKLKTKFQELILRAFGYRNKK